MKNSGLIKKIIILCLLFLPLGMAVPVVSDIRSRTFIIFPDIDKNRIEPLTDVIRDGRSSFDDFSYDSKKMHIKYILSNSNRHSPNVFVLIWFNKESPSIDLSEYKYITLRMKEASSEKITLYIKTFEQGISDMEYKKAERLRPDEPGVSLFPSVNSYKIMLSEYHTPQWWYHTFKTSEKNAGKEQCKNVVSFDLHFIHMENTPVKGELKSLVIEEIIFHKPVRLLSILSAIFLLPYYIIFITIYIVKRRRRKRSLPKYRHLSFVNYRDKELARIKEYIHTNYNDPDISTKKIQDKMGIPSVRIFNLVKEEYNLSFKQLINTIRVQKAKLLIKDSDLRIIEISYKIGFNDSTYFNKIFKQITGVTPTELRKQYIKN